MVDEEIKKNLKKMAKQTETKMVESILRWRYKKGSGKMPPENDLEEQSRIFTDRANRIISKTGKNFWKELKKAYKEGKEREEDKD